MQTGDKERQLRLLRVIQAAEAAKPLGEIDVALINACSAFILALEERQMPAPHVLRRKRKALFHTMRSNVSCKFPMSPYEIIMLVDFLKIM